MELLFVLLAVQLYVGYWAWNNLPPAAGMSNIYRSAKMTAIGLAVVPTGILYQLIAVAVAKAAAAKTDQATKRLAAASSDFRSPHAADHGVARRPQVAGSTPPTVGNPFSEAPSNAPPTQIGGGEWPGKSNSFVEEETGSQVNVDSLSGSPAQSHGPDPGARNPFL